MRWRLVFETRGGLTLAKTDRGDLEGLFPGQGGRIGGGSQVGPEEGSFIGDVASVRIQDLEKPDIGEMH